MGNEMIRKPATYDDFLLDLKERVRASQLRAALSVNRELVLLYWQIGRDILARQQQEGWGAKVIDRLADDLRREFPDMKGFSARNLKYMRAFAESYPDEPFVQAVPAQITWYHNCTLLDKVKNPAEREWYIRQTIENGWSRDILVHQIESRLYFRQGKAVTNFPATLPKPQSELARQILKDPYNFDFLSLGKDAYERDLERGLLEYIGKFLVELGAGFAFVGSQYHLQVGNFDFYIDLLFYHTHLHCYVAVDLKIGEFEPEFAGKMNFYLSAVDDLVKRPEDNPSIGLILCKTKDKTIAEYALRDMKKPLGVSTYQIVEALPKQYRKMLPAIEEIESGLTTEIDWDVFTPRPNYWFDSQVVYEGPGKAWFSAPEGVVSGQVTVRFDEFGQEQIVMKDGKIDETDRPLAFGIQEFLSGETPGFTGTMNVLSFGGKIRNICTKLEVTTEQGVFTATGNIPYGYSFQFGQKTSDVTFYPLWSQFDAKKPAEPKYCVLPLINFLAELRQSDPFNLDRHPLRIYPTPEIPRGLPEPDKAMVEYQANSKNHLIIFEFERELGFIEALPDYEEKQHKLQTNQLPTAETAVMVFGIGNHAIDYPSSPTEKATWFPGRFLDLLGLATGTVVGSPWIEFRNSQGVLVRRIHVRMNAGTFQKGRNTLGQYNYTGIGHLLTKAVSSPEFEHSDLHVAIRHVIKSGNHEQHLEERYLFLCRAVKCLYERFVTASNSFLDELEPRQKQKAQQAIEAAAKKITSGPGKKDAASQALAAQLLALPSQKVFLEVAFSRLFQHFAIPDAEILDGYYQGNPRPDGLNWIQALARYCRVPFEEGYFRFSERRYEAHDVFRFSQHLNDILIRILLKVLGYDELYHPTIITSLAQWPVDWLKAESSDWLIREYSKGKAESGF